MGEELLSSEETFSVFNMVLGTYTEFSKRGRPLSIYSSRPGHSPFTQWRRESAWGMAREARRLPILGTHLGEAGSVCVCVCESVLTWGALFLVCSVYWCPSVSLLARVADPVPPCCGMVGLALPLQGGRRCCDHRRLQVIDHETCVEQAQLYILCQVQRLLITLLLTLYHIGQCLTDRGICLCGIYLPLWHKSNMIL